MEFDGLRRDEERLGDVAVRLPLGRERADAALARRERRGTAERFGARPRARRVQLLPDALGERLRLAERGELEREAQRLARLGRPSGAALRSSERGERLGMLEAGDGALERLDRLLEL